MDINIPRMATIKNTAKLFGLPEHFIRQKAISGEIVSVKAGCKYLVNVDRFADYLNGHTEGQNATDSPETGSGGIHPIPINL